MPGRDRRNQPDGGAIDDQAPYEQGCRADKEEADPLVRAAGVVGVEDISHPSARGAGSSRVSGRSG